MTLASGSTDPLRIDPDRFMSESELSRRQLALDERGLRATGSPQHEDYVRELAQRLSDVGVPDVVLEAIPMRRWTPSRWELSAGMQPIPVLSPVAYSGATTAHGVEGRFSPNPESGCIGVVEVAPTSITSKTFDDLDWDATSVGRGPEMPYVRIWLSQDAMRAELARFAAAGAVGLVIVVDIPEEQCRQGYFLYDGVHRGLPAVFVSREGAAAARDAATTGAIGRLVLEAAVEEVRTHNIVACIPGRSDELVVLQSHTDGPNGLEDNGPEAIVAMASSLAELPTDDLPRSILLLLTTGHFAIEEAWGVEEFLTRHAGDLVPRIAAALTIEHLGALTARTDRSEPTQPAEYELGCTFATPHRAIIDVVRRALLRAQVTEPRVVRPFVPDTTGRSPDGTTWPGDGGPFWHTAGLPAANFITGPDYLFNVEPVARYIDVAAVRRQAIAFTDAALELAALPWSQLRARCDLP